MDAITGKNLHLPRIFLVIGPSGAGKDTLLSGAKAMIERCHEHDTDPLVFLLRDTTRPAAQCGLLERSVPRSAFSSNANGYAIRWTSSATETETETEYGILRSTLEEPLTLGSSVVLNVSRSTIDSVRSAYGAAAVVVVLSITAPGPILKRRLVERGRHTAEEIEERVGASGTYAPTDVGGCTVAGVSNGGSVGDGTRRVVRALRHPAAFDVAVVGVVGCSAAGKSTVCAALSDGVVGGTVACDDYYREPGECPRFDPAGEIRWPGGAVPEPFSRRGDADLNHPGAVDWERCEAGLDAAVNKIVDARLADGGGSGGGGGGGGYDGGVLILEGLLLLGAGAERLRDRCRRIVLLDDGFGDPERQEALWRRKWTRSGHLGKTSYKEQGVEEGEYERYWFDYVAKRWKVHGLNRIGMVDPRIVITIDCHASVDDKVEIITNALSDI